MSGKSPRDSPLRAEAEKRLARAPPAEAAARSTDELIHELQVHQVELEMQNEALRQAQVTLEESRDRYVDLYEFAPVGYVTLTDTDLIAAINLTGTVLLGEDRRKLLNRPFWRYVVSDDRDRWQRHFLQALRCGEKQTCELRLQRSDGTVFNANLDCLLIAAGAASRTLRVALTDITARKEAEQAILAAKLAAEQAKLAAEQADVAKSHFLAAASHDLRQPFQALRLFLDVLNEQLKEPRLLNVAQNASAALTAGENLLHALLDISKFDAGTVTVQSQSFIVSAIASALAAQYESLARQKGLELTVVPSSAVIDSDPVLLLRLLRNLLDNALKYTDRGRILLGCRRAGDRVRIEVWDTGLGINADQQQRIFDDFYQVGNQGREQSKGLGIGLAVVRRTAALLGHQITVRSWPGRGSVFAVTVGRSLA